MLITQLVVFSLFFSTLAFRVVRIVSVRFTFYQRRQLRNFTFALKVVITFLFFLDEHIVLDHS